MTTNFDIQITDQQSSLEPDYDLIRRAIEQVLTDAGKLQAAISVALVDNRQIHELNKAHLQHDYATDVLSFVFESTNENADGEIIVSAEMAADIAGRFGAEAHDELLLYIVHGALHLVGHDDKDEAARQLMVKQEVATLASIGVAAPVKRDALVGSSIPERRNSP